MRATKRIESDSMSQYAKESMISLVKKKKKNRVCYFSDLTQYSWKSRRKNIETGERPTHR